MMKRLLLFSLLLVGTAFGQIDKVKNFAISTVSTGYDASATSITLTSGKGSLFPDPASTGSYNIVWWNGTDYYDPSADPNKEIVRCTARSGDVLTVTRGQEGISATTKNTGGKTYWMMQSVLAQSYNAIIDTVRSMMDRRVFMPASGSIAIAGMTASRDSFIVLTAVNSITLNSGRAFELSGDAASPGNTKLYGTNGSGTKGWYDQPTGGSPAFSAITGATNTSAAMVVGSGASIALTGTGAVEASKIQAKDVSWQGRPQAAHRFSSVVFEQDSDRYVHRMVLKLDPSGTLGSTGKLYMDTDSTIKVGTGGGGAGTVTNTGGNLTANAVVLGAGTVDTKVSTGIVTNGASELTLGVLNTTIGRLLLNGNTSGTLTLAPTAAAGTTTITFPATTGTAAILGAQTFTGAQTFSSAAPQLLLGANGGNVGTIKLYGNTSGDVSIAPPAAAGTATALTLPIVSGTFMQYSSATIASNATWAPQGDARVNVYTVTAQAAAATTISNPSGTAVDFNELYIRVKDNGTARALTWSGSQWRASSDLALPTTTTISKTMYLKFLYNSADTKWDLVAYLDNF